MAKPKKKPEQFDMTVADLISMLEMQDQNAPVVVFNSRGGYESPTVTCVVKVRNGEIVQGESKVLLSAESDE